MDHWLTGLCIGLGALIISFIVSYYCHKKVMKSGTGGDKK